MPRVDVIVAVRNEEQNIPVFLAQLAALDLPPDVEVRVVFVEDSSTDGTRALLRRLARERPDTGYYTLGRGFGQALAVAFGLSRSTADAMIMMDVDGSHPVEAIPEMIDAWRQGAQVVQCVRRTLANRKAYRSVGAATFQFFARILTGVDTAEQNVFFRLISAPVAREFLRQPRYWRWLRFPLPRRPEGTLRKIHVDTRERVLGESKYNVWRLVNLAIDGILSLIPRARLAALVTVAVLVAVLLVRAGAWPLAVLVAAGILGLVGRYMGLQRDLLPRMRVVECANVA